MIYKVYYWRNEFVRPALMGDHTFIDPTNLDKTHVHLKDVTGSSLESVYTHMQAEVWSPNGEARRLIEEKGLGHTSMSMGDILIDERGDIWMVAMSGMDKIGKVETERK